MRRAGSVLLDMGSLGASNALGKLFWSLSLVMMMRALGPESYGQLVVVWSLAGMLAPVTDLGLTQLLLREGAREAGVVPDLLRRSLAARALLGLAGLAALAAAAALGLGTLGLLGAAIVALAAAAPLLDGAFATATAVAQVEHRVRLLAAWRVSSFALLPLLLWGLLAWRPDPVGASLAYLLATGLGLGGFFLLRGRAARAGAAPPKRFEGALARALPFLAMGLAALSYGRLEVAVVGFAGDAVSAGFYHAAYQVVLLVFSLSEVFFTAVFAPLYRAHADRARLQACWPPIVRMLCALVVVCLPPLWWYAGEVMATLGGAAFTEAGPVLQALLPMVAALPVAASMNYLMLVDRPGLRAAIDAACVAGTAVLIVLVLPRWGITGAAWAASATYLAASGLAWWLVRRQGIRLPWLASLLLAALLAAPAAALMALAWPHWWLGAAAHALAAAALLLALRYLKPADLGTLAH